MTDTKMSLRTLVEKTPDGDLLRGVRLVVSDAHEGITAAVAKGPGASGIRAIRPFRAARRLFARYNRSRLEAKRQSVARGAVPEQHQPVGRTSYGESWIEAINVAQARKSDPIAVLMQPIGLNSSIHIFMEKSRRSIFWNTKQIQIK